MSKSIIEHMSSISEKMRCKKERPGRMGPSIKISEATLTEAAEDIDALRQRLGLNAMQVLILTAVLENSARHRIDASDIAAYLGLDYLKFLSYSDDMETLKRRGYLLLKPDGDVILPGDVLRSLKANKAVEPEKVAGLDTHTILARLRRKFSLRSDDMLTYWELLEDIRLLMDGSPETSIAKCYRAHGLDHYEDETVFFFAILLKYYSDSDDNINWFDVEDYFEEDNLNNLRYRFNSEILGLQIDKVIEFSGDGDMMSKDFFKIADAVKGEALADVGGLQKKAPKVSASRRVEAGTIRHKDLFYNPGEGRQVRQLHDLMGEKRYGEIREALLRKGLRTGFTCLFYGGPGTGKTETVYQLARECGRDLFVVDVSQIKSCWVGESEKNIKEVFDKYRKAVSAGGTVPILLFNEADAIFGIRAEGAERAVDKMENAIQNIILQEMEDLDGILIATTNLTTNLDKAFERRFLYKVRFEKPCTEARSHIWTSMLSELSGDEALRLASDFDFSGGQIENISRKKAVKELIDGVSPTFEQIVEFCTEENIGEQSARRRIGF